MCVRENPCRHCGQPLLTFTGDGIFCCPGCASAYALIEGLGLDTYYQRRTLDPKIRPPRPDDQPPATDYAAYASETGDGGRRIEVMVDGLHCAACVWLIESVLGRQPGVRVARLNMTTRRLELQIDPDATSFEDAVAPVIRMGYRLVPFHAGLVDDGEKQRQQELLRAMAVAGFAAANVMLLSVAIWAGYDQGMGPATRTLLHWISALIALPAIVYAGRPFFRSAIGALRHGRSNMDVPIAIGVCLTAAISLTETIRGADHAYFESATGLLFFLLIGRYLDRRARGQARSAATQMLALNAAAVRVADAAGGERLLPPDKVEPGMRVLVAVGARIGVDGRIIDGETTIDTSLIDGESLPKPARLGTEVFAGTLNLGSPIIVEALKVGENTLLAEIARLVEAAESQKGRFVALADRVARYYAPVVHLTALVTFLGWWLGAGIPWQPALVTAVAVLIITCPCALALAVPAVQVVATGRLLRRGILIKSGTALERLARAEMIVFDKTGTLTEGRPVLVNGDRIDDGALLLAASMALASTHPLARAVVRAAQARGIAPLSVSGVTETPGQGLRLDTPDGYVLLGSRKFCVLDDDDTASDLELWLFQPPLAAVRFVFADRPRADAEEVIFDLEERHAYQTALMSGDREATVAALAREVGMMDWRSELVPKAKVAQVEALKTQERYVLFVGDGLNDAPALAAAQVSMSPATAADIAQVAADVIFQGDQLEPVREALLTARRARWLIRQNLAFSLLYNLCVVPLAIAGQVTPLIAAIAMSSSSLVVMLNSLRLARASFPRPPIPAEFRKR